MRWPNLLRGSDPDAEAPGGWRTGRVVLLGACGLGLAMIIANAIANPAQAPKEEEARVAAATTASWAPKSLAAYTPRPEPAPPPAPMPESEPAPAHGDPLPLSSAAVHQAASPPEALLAAASGHIGVWPAQAGEGAPAAPAPAVNTATVDPAAPAVTGGAARGCVITAGTLVPVQLVTAASSDHAGAVVARVARDVLGADGCLGIEAGATLVGQIGAARDFGQERGEVVFEALYTLDGRQVDLASAAAGDALGMGGVPGEVNLHTGAKALRVAVATAVDLGGAYLGGRGDGLNILLGHSGRAIDEWARQALERKPSITLDPLKAPTTLTVIIQRPITL